MDIEFWVLNGTNLVTTQRRTIPSWWDYAKELDTIRSAHPGCKVRSLRYDNNGHAVMEIVNV